MPPASRLPTSSSPSSWGLHGRGSLWVPAVSRSPTGCSKAELRSAVLLFVLLTHCYFLLFVRVFVDGSAQY